MNSLQKENRRADRGTADSVAMTGFPLKPHVSPHGSIIALSMMKDEGPYVLEWVAHHLSLGFTDLVVYTNDCSDGTDDMLIRLENLGLVHHRHNEIAAGMRPQPSALKQAQNDPVVKNSDWLLVFDADEFLCLKHGDRSLDSLIAAVKAEDANGIVITWRVFGSNGLQDWSRAPVTEQYLGAAPPMWNKGWGVKTLFQFNADHWKLGIHRPKIKNKYLQGDFPHTVKWLNGSGRPMEDYFKFRGWRSIARTVGYDWAQMNHYAIKSIDSYAIRKLRGNVNNKANKYSDDYWSLQDRNEVHDKSALVHREKRQKIYDLLLTDPVLSRLHFAAVKRVEEQLASFKKTSEYDALVASLKLASTVPIKDVIAKPPKARDPIKIAAQMSQIERQITEKPTFRTRVLSVEEQPYVTGHIELSERIPTESFENHQIGLPADPRIFSPPALQAITEGKFMRNHARRLPGLVRPGDSYLEIGAGVGFIAAHLALQYPQLSIRAQEERLPLLATARKIWSVNIVAETDARRLCDTPLFAATDAQHEASGLKTLIKETACTVLFANDPRLSSKMISWAIDASLRPQTIIIGPRALANACSSEGIRGELPSKGYLPPESQTLSDALVFRCEARA